MRTGKFDALVSTTNNLAKVALVPIIKRFPDYAPIIDSDLVNVWDCLMTIAMTGVATHAASVLTDPQSRHEIREAMDQKWKFGGKMFDDYYDYMLQRTSQTNAPWSGVSAMWVADNLRLHERANSALRHNAGELLFIDRLSSFMNISFGGTGGLHDYLGIMASEVNKEQDPEKKAYMLAYVFELFASKVVDFIAEKICSRNHDPRSKSI